VKVARIEDILHGQKKSFRVLNTRVLIVNLKGKFYAVQSKCPHLGSPLFTGRLDGKILRCDNHGSGFDITTGKVVAMPPDVKCISPLKVYPIRIDGSDIIVDIPD
jgi:nitrite reductase/ring-hydroxylating ferredoxin subunit